MKCHAQMIIWNNNDIKIDNQTIFFHTWFDKGVYTLRDFLDQNLNFLTSEEFKLWYQLQTNVLTYYGVINAIPQKYKKAMLVDIQITVNNILLENKKISEDVKELKSTVNKQQSEIVDLKKQLTKARTTMEKELDDAKKRINEQQEEIAELYNLQDRL